MPPQSQVVDTIKNKILGSMGSAPDLCMDYHHYPFKVDFFGPIKKLKRNFILGFMLSPDPSVESYIVIIHKTLEQLEKNHKRIAPDVIITFRVRKCNGTVMPLLSGEGSNRIDLSKFDPKTEEIVFDLLKQIAATTSKFNHGKIKSMRSATKQKK